MDGSSKGLPHSVKVKKHLLPTHAQTLSDYTSAF